MVDKPFNYIRLIPEFSGEKTYQPMVEWIEHVVAGEMVNYLVKPNDSMPCVFYRKYGKKESY